MSSLNLKQKLNIIRLALYPAVTTWCCLFAIVVSFLVVLCMILSMEVVHTMYCLL